MKKITHTRARVLESHIQTGECSLSILQFSFIKKAKKFNKDSSFFLLHRCRKIAAPDAYRLLNIIQESDPELYTYPGGKAALSNAFVVAAIDLGNTFSGYAFATRNDFEKNPFRIHVPTWCDSRSISYKTKSTVLINMDAQVVAFGSDAESNYADLLEEGEGEDYFYFPHFKMMLYDHAKTKV